MSWIAAMKILSDQGERHMKEIEMEDTTTTTFRYERLPNMEEVRSQIKECEGQHVQQAIFSTFMDTLTQVCFTEQVVRSSIMWEGNRSWTPGS